MILDGKQISQDIIENIKLNLRQTPLEMGLAVILVGNDSASERYVSIKQKTCENLGIHFELHQFSEDAHQLSIEKKIKELNKDSKINGILVQLPLPSHLNTQKILHTLDPIKDVDGFHQANIQSFIKGESNFIGGLPKGIWKLLEATKENLKQKTALIISKSPQFGETLIKLLDNHNINAKWIAPNDNLLKTELIKSDIVISAIGKAHMITGEFVKTNSILIDVGINKLNGKTVGDMHFESCSPKALAITPVPGGVGPMTVAMLIENLVELTKKQKNLLD